ncbi:MAG: hypothetical protein ACR2PL_08100, partial [Dehalococcoidia bacterium]
MENGPIRRRKKATPIEQTDEESALQRRLSSVRLIVVLVFCALVLQLSRVQFLQGGRYRLLAQTNQIKVIQTMPARGLIFDRAGRQLVENQPSFSVVLTPAELPKGHELDAFLSVQSELGVPATEIQRKVDEALKHNPPDQPVTLAEHVEWSQALKLAELRSEVPALDVVTEPSRYYTLPLLSKVIGYVGKLDEGEYRALSGKGYELDDTIGKTGLELSYEDRLRGTPGRRTAETDVSGRELRSIEEVPAQPGENLTLTLDSTLQENVSKILADSLAQYHSASGVALMMDVHAGDILAYASLPTYD